MNKWRISDMTETKMRNVLNAQRFINFDKIETGAVTLGIPDTWYYSTKALKEKCICGWAELKRVPSFKKNVIKIPWRPKQLEKGRQYYEAGAKVWLIITDENNEWMFISASDWQEYYSRTVFWRVGYHVTRITEVILTNLL
jgi:hypothetical protein